MSPEHLYWIALLAIVLPSAPFNKSAIVVLLVWAFGHMAHVFGPYEHVAYMFARIVGLGAALGLSMPWNGSRHAYAYAGVAVLFAPVAILSIVAAAMFNEQPKTMEEYHTQTIVYWTTYTVIMLQALIIPFGNDWHRIKELAKRLDEALLRRIDKHFNGAL